MNEFLSAVFVSFGVIFVSELGDKTQILAAVLATKFRPYLVLLGLTIGSLAAHLIAVTAGWLIGGFISDFWLGIAAAIFFLAYAAWAWFSTDTTSESEVATSITTTRNGRSLPIARILISIIGAFLLAELLDKTSLATLTLSTNYHTWGVIVGSTLGMIASGAIAVALGKMLAAKLSPQVIRVGSTIIFAVFGIVLLLSALI